MNSLVLSLQRVTRVYLQGGRELRVLDQLNLQLKAGEMVGLLGPSGSGKSTLLRVIARLVRPNSGKVQVCGIDLLRDPELGRERLGFVAHSSYLYRNLTAFENLKFFAGSIVYPTPMRASEVFLVGLGWRRVPVGESTDFHAACNSGSR